jgi:hypothetical protein
MCAGEARLLVIKQEQLELLAEDVARRFEERLSRDIAALFPEQMALMARRHASEADPVLAAVRRNLELASGYAIEEWIDLAVFVALAAANLKLTEPGKPGYLSWTRQLLELPEADGKSRVALIEHRIGVMAQTDERAADLKAVLVKLRESY